MSIFTNVKRFLFSVSTNALFKMSQVAGGGTSLDDWMKITSDDRKRIPMKDLEYYIMHPVTRRALWLKAMAVAGKGYTMVHENDKIKKLCYELTNTEGYRRNLVTGVFQAFGYGEGYVENLWNDTFKEQNNVVEVENEGDELTGTSITDPKTFTPISDDKGIILKYVQKVTDKHHREKKIYFPARRITFIKFDQVGGSVRGYGLVEPAVPIIKGLIMGRKTRFNRLFRMGNPFLHAKYNAKEISNISNQLQNSSPSDARKLDPKTLLERDLKNANEKSLLITSDLFTVEWMGIKDKAEDLTPMIRSLYEELAGAFGLPVSVILQSGEKENRAVLDRITLWDQDEIENYQELLSDIIKEQQLRPLLDANGYENEDVPDIEWNVLSEEKNAIVYANDKILTEYLSMGVTSGILPVDVAQKIMFERMGEKRESELETNPSLETPLEQTQATPPEEKKAVTEAGKQQSLKKRFKRK